MKFLSELGILGHHLSQASRELLLVVRSLVKLADESVGASDKEELQGLKPLLGSVRKTVEKLTEQFASAEEAKFNFLYSSVIRSITWALDDEIARSSRAASTKGRGRREVLETVRTFLIKDLEERKGRRRDAAA